MTQQETITLAWCKQFSYEFGISLMGLNDRIPRADVAFDIRSLASWWSITTSLLLRRGFDGCYLKSRHSCRHFSSVSLYLFDPILHHVGLDSKRIISYQEKVTAANKATYIRIIFAGFYESSMAKINALQIVSRSCFFIVTSLKGLMVNHGIGSTFSGYIFPRRCIVKNHECFNIYSSWKSWVLKSSPTKDYLAFI